MIASPIDLVSRSEPIFLLLVGELAPVVSSFPSSRIVVIYRKGVCDVEVGVKQPKLADGPPSNPRRQAPEGAGGNRVLMNELAVGDCTVAGIASKLQWARNRRRTDLIASDILFPTNCT